MSEADNPNVVDEDKFRLDGRLTAPELFVEGWTHFYLGYPITRFVFHNIVEPPSEGQKELRRAAATLCMPTAVAVQMAQMIIASSKENESLLTQAAEQGAQQLKLALSMVSATAFPPGLTSKELSPAKASKP